MSIIVAAVVKQQTAAPAGFIWARRRKRENNF